MLTTTAVLDRAFTRIKDNSSALRVKMLGWLDSAMRDAWGERTWIFLEKSVVLTLVNGAITLPADFGDETFLNVGGLYALTTADKLTPTEALKADVRGGDVWGYTLSSTAITLHPATTGTVTLYYVAKMPDAGYADDSTETIFPMEFLPLFERSMLAAFYEYDVDADRLPTGVQLDAEHLRKLKKLDNSRKPLPQLNTYGLVREK
jgi:hypothetical protein